MIKRYFLIVALFLAAPGLLPAQAGAKEESVKGTNGYIEYIRGNMPLVISIPHDGHLLPDEIPDRPCINCSKNRDIHTIEIGRAVSKFIMEETGFYPYMVINYLHRTRLDPNRNIAEAASGNQYAETAWAEFHDFINTAVSDIQKQFGKGLYIDLHGHRHTIRRTELGYLVTAEELRLPDDFLNDPAFYEYSSLRSLIASNLNNYSYTQLLRGDASFGSLLEERGYITVPSSGHPFPAVGEPHFSGGFNTNRHSSAAGGTVDGIQIEIDIELRQDPAGRIEYARALADVILDYLRIHYFENFETTFW